MSKNKKLEMPPQGMPPKGMPPKGGQDVEGICPTNGNWQRLIPIPNSC